MPTIYAYFKVIVSCRRFFPNIIQSSLLLVLGRVLHCSMKEDMFPISDADRTRNFRAIIGGYGGHLMHFTEINNDKLYKATIILQSAAQALLY